MNVRMLVYGSLLDDAEGGDVRQRLRQTQLAAVQRARPVPEKVESSGHLALPLQRSGDHRGKA
ncbi:hypothetical protein ACFW9L_44740, partial [Streptomyces sp. NPDC059517]|uniref:hypothetical protein n=1 Tax=Streptomyces sp. NPDC059517 TaxID=3346855 RepID=UPI0036AB7E11